MALEGCSACLKYLMVIWNIIVLILSIGILGMGIWLAVMDFSQFMDAAQSTDKDVVFDGAQEVGPFLLKVIGYVLIATGSIAIVIAFLGCCGALRESQCMLTTCFILLSTLFLVFVGFGIYLFVKRGEAVVPKEEIDNKVLEVLRKNVANYYSDEDAKELMDSIQSRYDCCGADNGESDYTTVGPVPDSCSLSFRDDPCFEPYRDDVLSKFAVLDELLVGKLTIAMAVSLGIAGALLLAMAWTLFLCCLIRRSGSY